MGGGPGDDASTVFVKELDDRWSASSGRRSVPPGSRRVSHVTEHRSGGSLFTPSREPSMLPR